MNEIAPMPDVGDDRAFSVVNGKMDEKFQDINKNRLFSLLPPHDLLWLTPLLELVHWNTGQILVRPNQPVSTVYFPISGLVSVLAETSAGRRFEVGMYGREGMGPASVVAGDDLTPNLHIVQVGGLAFSITRAGLKHATTRCPALLTLLMRYIDAFAVQVGYTALSNGGSNRVERLARWLLMYRDRLDSDDLPLSEEVLGVMLGGPSSDVNEVTGMLEKTSIIRATRGNIRILDRTILEQLAGENYSVPEAEYRRLVGLPDRGPRTARKAGPGAASAA